MSEIKIFLCLLTILISFCKLFTHVFFFFGLVSYLTFGHFQSIFKNSLYYRYYPLASIYVVNISLNCHSSLSFTYGDFFFPVQKIFFHELSSSLLTFIAFPLCHSWKAFPYTKVKKNSAVFTYNVFEFLHLRI